MRIFVKYSLASETYEKRGASYWLKASELDSDNTSVI